MKTIKITMELPTPPDGWRYTGEYRVPKKNEHYFLAERDLWVLQSTGTITSRHFILQKET
jgi:hypothetical protein